MTTTSARVENRSRFHRVAGFPVEDVVVGLALDVVPDHRGIRVQRLLGIHYRFQRFVVDFDEFEGIAGDVFGVGDDERHLLMLETNLVGGQHGLHVRGQCRHPGQTQGGQGLAGDHRVHTREGGRRRGIDGPDPSVRIGTPQDRRVQHPGHRHVIDVIALPAKESRVLLAWHPAEADRVAGRTDPRGLLDRWFARLSLSCRDLLAGFGGHGAGAVGGGVGGSLPGGL